MNALLQNEFQPARSLVSLAWHHHETVASLAAIALPGFETLVQLLRLLTV